MTPALAPSLIIEEKARPAVLLSIAPFIVWFLVASFLPDTLTPKPILFDIPVQATDLLLIGAALLSFAGWLCTWQLSARTRWHRNLPLWVSLVIAYAAISVVWSGMDSYNSWAMLLTLCLAGAAFVLPFSVIASLPQGQIRSLTRMIALGLAGVSAVYCAVTFLGLSVRSELGHFYTYGFGIERLKGPLFASSTGYMILVPAAAVLLQDWLEGAPGHRFANACGLAALSISILGLGSRFALLVTGLFTLSLFLIAFRARNFGIVAITLLGLGLSGVLMFQYASTERLQSFRDDQRAGSYSSSLRIVTEREPVVSIAGSGYGSVWPWYLRDWEMADRIARGDMTVSTEYGTMLYQPHSVFLLVVVELGVMGLLFFTKLWTVLGQLVFRGLSERENSLSAFGMAFATLGMFADTILFKNPRVSVVWWFFLLAALAAHRDPERGPSA